MIILLGPDNSGKTTLSQKIAEMSRGSMNEHHPWKAMASTGYKDYMHFLRGEKSNPLDVKTYHPGLALQHGGQIVADRFFYCELPYARILRKSERIQWSLKQWHNMHLSTISFNPVFVLAVGKAEQYSDSVPEELFEPIKKEYQYWLHEHDIEYLVYDFRKMNVETVAEELLLQSMYRRIKIDWWLKMARTGLAGVGNTVNPRVFIMAQDIGPSNVHRIPFEQGPSGYYLSDLLDIAEVPLGSFYLTNWRKTPDEETNIRLLREELLYTMPKYVLLLGREAAGKVPLRVIDEYPAIQIKKLYHPGWVVNHAGRISELKKRKEWYLNEWKNVWEEIIGAKAAMIGSSRG